MEPLTADDPRKIGRYRVLTRLGAGGMGRVYLAQGKKRLVAIKVLLGWVTADPVFRERFAQEITLAERVSGPYTARVIDSDTHADPPWLATEYVPGPSLPAAVAHSGPLPESTLWTLTMGLAEALGTVHATGIVHRDLKPHNVLLAADRPRLIDFGIAKALYDTGAGTMTPSGAVLGTPGYMSPEQVLGDELAPSSDMFSLGAVLAYAATGRAPFGSGDLRAVCFRILEAEPALDGVPTALLPLVTACLAKDPDDRPTPGELLAGLPAAVPVPDVDEVDDWLPSPVGDLVATLATEVRRVAPTLAKTRVAPRPPPDPPDTRPPKGDQPPPPGPVPPPPEIEPPAPEPPPDTEPPPHKVRDALGARRGALWLVAAVVALVVVGTQLNNGFFTSSGPVEVLRRTYPGDSLWLSQDGTRYAVITDQGVNLHDTTSGDELARFPVTGVDPNDHVIRFASADGAVLSIPGDEDTEVLWDVETDELTTVPHPTAAEDLPCGDHAMALSPDGATLAGTDGYTTTLWDVAAAETTIEIQHGDTVDVDDECVTRSTDVSFSPDGESVLVDLYEPGLWAWYATATGEELGVLDDLGDFSTYTLSTGGDTLVLVQGSSVEIWDVGAGAHVATPIETDGHLSVRDDALALSPDGGYVAVGDVMCRTWYQRLFGLSCDDQGLVLVADVETGELAATLEHEDPDTREAREEQIAAIERTNEENQAECAELNNQMSWWRRFWEGRVPCPPKLDVPSRDNPVRAIAFLPDGDHMATVDEFGSLVLWEMP